MPETVLLGAFEIYVNHTTNRIRALLGNKPLIWINDCYMGWPYIPRGIDLIGMDGYSPTSNASDEIGHVKSLYSTLWPMLGPHQGALHCINIVFLPATHPQIQPPGLTVADPCFMQEPWLSLG